MGSPRGELKRRVLAISGLGTLAFAWPVLDLFGRNPEVFVANRTSPAQVVAFGLVVALLVPAVGTILLWSSELMDPRAGRATFMALVTVLSLATGLVIARQMAGSAAAAVLISLLVAGLVLAVHHWASGFLTFTSVALPAAVVLFLFASPAAGLLFDRVTPSEVSGDVRAPVPILFVQMDEFPLASIVTPTGEVNENLFPNFARLAREGTWYRNAFSDSIATTQSIPSILTGRRFERGMRPSFEDHPDNLFTLLADDYRMHVIEWVASMCPIETCPDYAGRAPARFASLLADAAVVYGHLAAPPGTEDALPSIDNSWRGFLGQAETPEGEEVAIPGLPVPDQPIRADWIEWLQRIANGVGRTQPPILSYVHVPAPHVPWVTNPSGTHYERPEQYTEVEGVGGDGRWAGEQAMGVIAFQRHLYQLGFLDAMLGRIFTEMDRTGVWDDSLVVVLADHGASFELGEHRRWPYQDNLDDLYRVPLFVKYPRQPEGDVVDEPVFGVDVLPTIVDVLEVRTNWKFDGISLLDVEGTDRSHVPMWWCCSRLGTSTDLATLFDQVARNHRWVPDQTTWDGVAGIGPFAHLVGVELADLDVTQDSRVGWQLELGDDLMAGERPHGVVQTFLKGRVTYPEDAEPGHVLLVVNGTVAGVAYVLSDGPGSGSFQGVITESVVGAGPSQLDVLVPGPSEVWLSGAAADLTIEWVTPDGRHLDVRPEGARRIQVDRVETSDSGAMTLVGWAADVSAKVPPKTVHVFAGEHLVASTPPNIDNRNVVAWFGSEDLARSGFFIVIDAEALPDGIAQLTVIAEFDDHAVSESVVIGG